MQELTKEEMVTKMKIEVARWKGQLRDQITKQSRYRVEQQIKRNTDLINLATINGTV